MYRMSYRYEEEVEEDEEEDNNDEVVWQPALINRARQRNFMIINHSHGVFVPIAFDDIGFRTYGPIIFSARIHYHLNHRIMRFEFKQTNFRYFQK